MATITRKRVGSTTVRITRTARDELVGIGDRFDAQVEGRVTALAAAKGNLFVGTSKGIVSRLETQTGRRCARAVFDAPITKLSVRGAVLKVLTRNDTFAVTSSTLRKVK
jgi:hypothetical protein